MKDETPPIVPAPIPEPPPGVKVSKNGNYPGMRKHGMKQSPQRKGKEQARTARRHAEDVVRISYTPNRGQRVFAEMIAGGRKITLANGGRQGGKTYAGARESLKQIYKYHRAPALGWIVSPTYPMSLVVERAFEDAAGWLESGGLIIKKMAGQRAYLLFNY